jgi:transposase-like protein
MNPPDPKSSLPKSTRRRYYDEQFKRDAVALLESGRSATQLSRELGISLWNLRDWKRLFGNGGAKAAEAPAQVPSPGGTVEMAVELAELRRKLEASERQRDILKKALAIVAQEPPNATR